jgi:copper oxidase (laccase) domain-containing protein
MKIFRRPEVFTADCVSDWPSAFQQFLKNVDGFTGEKITPAAQDNELTIVPHGGLGAKVICSRQTCLPSSWRVAAFHSNIVCEQSEFNPDELKKGDGIAVRADSFTAPLAIATADCLAVALTLECDGQILLASCFHAGWRGYTSGIQHSALHWMMQQPEAKRLASWRRHLHVTIGPAIAGRSYPCGADVKDALERHLEERLRAEDGWSDLHEQAFVNSLHSRGESHTSADKIYPDLQALMTIELSAAGIPLDQLSIIRENTFASRWWPSHRRAMAEGRSSAGRLVTHLCPPACP